MFHFIIMCTQCFHLRATYILTFCTKSKHCLTYKQKYYELNINIHTFVEVYLLVPIIRLCCLLLHTYTHSRSHIHNIHYCVKIARFISFRFLAFLSLYFDSSTSNKQLASNVDAILQKDRRIEMWEKKISVEYKIKKNWEKWKTERLGNCSLKNILYITFLWIVWISVLFWFHFLCYILKSSFQISKICIVCNYFLFFSFIFIWRWILEVYMLVLDPCLGWQF